MTTFSKWLDAHCPTGRPLRPEPTMAYGMAETLVNGDCYDDGTLRLGKERVDKGRVWLPERQAQAATYYGWKISGYVIYSANGEELHLVSRGV